jgi:flagellar biosynthesis anti-sigma factor FlgM
MRIDPSFQYDPSSQYLGNVAPDTVGSAQGAKIPPPQTGAGAGVESTVDAGDTVQFSGTLSEAQQLKAQLAQTPDVRANRVAALQQQVAQGTYQPSNGQIASAMMSELLGTGNPQ